MVCVLPCPTLPIQILTVQQHPPSLCDFPTTYGLFCRRAEGATVLCLIVSSPSITRNRRRRSGAVSVGSIGATVKAASSKSPIDHTCFATSAIAGLFWCAAHWASGSHGRHGNCNAATYSLTAAAWFSSFLEKLFVRRVNRRDAIRIERFERSTYDVEICAGTRFHAQKRPARGNASGAFLLVNSAVHACYLCLLPGKASIILTCLLTSVSGGGHG